MGRVYKWEVLKLLAQKRTYLGLGAAMAVPLVFVIVLTIQTGGAEVGVHLDRQGARLSSVGV